MSEAAFVGLNQNKVTEYKFATQLLPVYYNNTSRTITYPVSETAMELGNFSTPSEHMLYMLRLNLSAASFEVIVAKGTSSAVRTPLFTLNYTGTGNVSVVKQKSYIDTVEAYLNGSALTVFVHYSPSIYFPSSPEYFYLESNFAGSVVVDSLIVDSYISNFVEGFKADKPNILTKCTANQIEVEVGGPFNWDTMFPAKPISWTSWDQENFMFWELQASHPTATMEDF